MYHGPITFTSTTQLTQMKNVGHGEFINSHPSTRGSVGAAIMSLTVLYQKQTHHGYNTVQYSGNVMLWTGWVLVFLTRFKYFVDPPCFRVRERMKIRIICMLPKITAPQGTWGVSPALYRDIWRNTVMHCTVFLIQCINVVCSVAQSRVFYYSMVRFSVLQCKRLNVLRNCGNLKCKGSSCLRATNRGQQL